MILRLGTGWQTITADLALILFLLTAQASSDPPAAPERAEPSAATMMDSNGAGLAIYRPGPGTNLGQWLQATLTDDRQGATVFIRYPAEGRDAAIRGGSDLLAEIEAQGMAARLVLEPGPRAESMVLVGYEGEPEDGTILAE